MLLCHGTSTRFLSAILKTGISPRSKKGESNWEHGTASNPNAVYLTTACALGPYLASLGTYDSLWFPRGRVNYAAEPAPQI